MKKYLWLILAVCSTLGFGITRFLLIASKAQAQLGPAQASRGMGSFYAPNYNWGVGAIRLSVGNTATGSQIVTMNASAVALPDGRVLLPFATNASLTFDTGANAETITPSAVSGCSFPAAATGCTVTATFANTHGVGTPVMSGTFGLQEAINDANGFGGGNVVVDGAFRGTNSTITGIVSTTPAVWVADERGPGPMTWYGKSGTGAAAYSASNNDISFQVTLAANTATKTLSQTYAVAPTCVATDFTTANLTKVAPTTTTVVVSDTVGATDVMQVHCDIVK